MSPAAAPASPLLSPPRRGWHLAAFACAYPLLDWISYIHPMAQFNITPWNPQPALAIALLMLYGLRCLPAVLLVAIVTEQAIRDTPTPFFDDILVAIVLTLCYGGIARMLARDGRPAPLDSTRDVLRLVGGVVLGVLATGILYVGALVAVGAGPLERFPEALLRFWIGDSVGILVFLPLVLMLADPARRARLAALLLRPEAFAQAVSVVALLVFVFWQNLADHVKFFYLLFLPLVWATARGGLAGGAVAALLIQTGTIVAVHFTAQSAFTVFELQTFLIALTIMGLFLGVTVDERARAEGALRDSQKLAAAGQMAGALAHELSQPLTALANYARAGQLLVAAGPDERPRLAETLDKLVAESRRAADVVRRLRDFLLHGAMRIEPLRLDALATRVAAGLRDSATAAGVELRLDLDPHAPTVRADALQIEIVLRNLLRNAIEAAGAGSGARRVELRLAAVPQGVVLRVADSGAGVSAERAERIFEPFASTKASGMGMGLAVSRAIVAAHRGRLRAEAGVGGVFHLELPVGEDSHE
jgi:signal transduction histidine kinase